MRDLRKNIPKIGFWITVVFIMLGTSSIYGQEMTKASGKLTLAYAKMDSLIVGDVEGHKMTFAESKGTNTSTGDNGFMEGAEAVNFAFGDLVMGSGPNQGYVTFSSDDGKTFAKWQGEVKTTMDEEGNPITTISGTYEYIKGSGKFENIQGSGTYSGQFTSPTEYSVSWEGEYTLK